MRFDKDLKGHVLKIMSSQSDYLSDNPKRATAKIASLEQSINLILQKLEEYNCLLEELKDMNPNHIITLTELVGRIAEENNDRKKEMQDFRKQHQQLDQTILNSCEKLETVENELYSKF